VDGGKTWIKQKSFDTGSLASYIRLACSGTWTCYASSGYGLVSTSDGGASWSVRQITVSTDALACDPAGGCVSAGQGNYGTPLLQRVSGLAERGYSVIDSNRVLHQFGDALSFFPTSQLAAGGLAAFAESDDGSEVLGTYPYAGPGWAPTCSTIPGAGSSDLLVGFALTLDDGGCWLAGVDGGVFALGDARFYGSAGALHLNRPIVGMAATPDGHGYWLVASDGGIFNYGDAHFYGSTGAIHLNRPIVGMGATPDGHGYWLVASDGGIFNYGDAHFYGSTGAIHLNAPIVGMAATPDGHGYWLLGSDGGIFNYGNAPYLGNTVGSMAGGSALGIVGTA
jgi:hypothetical protein